MKIRSLLFFVLFSCQFGYAQNGQPAGILFSQALDKAKKENKNLILVFTSSWCGPCKEMRKLINDVYNIEFFEKNYVILELYNSEIGEKKKNENFGTDSLIVRYDADSTSIPFWLILNPTGKKMYDGYEYKVAKDPTTRSNSGFSLNPDYLKEFLVIIKKTSKLTTQQIELIYERGRQLSKLTREED